MPLRTSLGPNLSWTNQRLLWEAPVRDTESDVLVLGLGASGLYVWACSCFPYGTGGARKFLECTCVNKASGMVLHKPMNSSFLPLRLIWVGFLSLKNKSLNIKSRKRCFTNELEKILNITAEINYNEKIYQKGSAEPQKWFCTKISKIDKLLGKTD